MSGKLVDAPSLWDTKLFHLNREEKAASDSFREWLRSSPSDLGEHLADIAEKTPLVSFDLKDVSTLEALIVRSKAKRADAILPLGILSKVIYHLNRRYQRSIPQPRYVFKLKRETNPLVPDNDLAHESVRLCFALEKNWINSLSPSRNKTVRDARSNIPPELIVFSAALYGGILDIDIAVALHNALQAPDGNFYHSAHSGRVYADLLIATDGLPAQEMRRWYPNDKLICLISRTAVSELQLDPSLPVIQRRRIIADKIWASVQKEMEREMLNPDLGDELDECYLPKSLADAFEKVRIVMHSEIPSVLAEYAAGKVDCRSLRPSSIGRIYGDPSPAANLSHADNREDEPDFDAGDEKSEDNVTVPGIEPPWTPALRKSLRGEDEKANRTAKLRLVCEPSRIIGILVTGITQQETLGSRWHSIRSGTCKILLTSYVRSWFRRENVSIVFEASMLWDGPLGCELSGVQARLVRSVTLLRTKAFHSFRSLGSV